MLTVNLKHEELYHLLRGELIKLRPGEKFFSIRDIMKRYEVSQLTVDKALSKLRSEGLLKNSAGKGLYASEHVSRLSRKNPPTYLLVVPQWKSVDIDVLEYTVRDVAASYPEQRLLVQKFDPSCAMPHELPLQEENVAGIILLTSSNNLRFEDLQRINNYQRPLIMLGHHLENLSITGVGADDVFAGNLAADYLLRHGHRHIAIFLSEPHNAIIMTRVKAICDYAELHGVETEIIDCEVKTGEVATEKAYHKFTDVLKREYSFTAVVGICGDSMQGAVNACHNHNVRIPEDLSMVAIGGETLTQTFYPSLTTVALDFESQVKTALLLLDQMVNNPGQEVKSVYHRPVIIEHKSVITI